MLSSYVVQLLESCLGDFFEESTFNVNNIHTNLLNGIFLFRY